jgi:hypothetical protein
MHARPGIGIVGRRLRGVSWQNSSILKHDDETRLPFRAATLP